ncbi:MAG: peptidase M23, partial [Firmicutes bacterium]|nr:peptidase M23 [Bacillota bacterium]
MKRPLKLLSMLLVVVLIVTAMPTVVFANNQNKLNNVKDQISSIQKELNEGKKEEKDLISQISALNSKINTIENEINQIAADIATKIQKIEEAEIKLVETQAAIDSQNVALNKRLRVMYKNGETGMLEILLGSSNISDFLSNLDMIQKIYDNDMKILKKIQEQYVEIEEQKAQMEVLKKQLEEKKVSQEAKQQELEKEKSSVQALKNQVASDNKALEKQIDQLNAEANALTALIQSQQNKGQASSSSNSQYTGGAMAWPVPASRKITSPYGYRIHPILGVKKFHSGIDIGAGSGTAIVAAADGKVTMS